MKTKKGLAVLLAVMLAFSCLSLTAFASEDNAFQVITPEGKITGYKTVQDARNAMQDGYTLKLLKDYVSTSDYNFGISLDEHDITIDLNGYNVTSNNTKAPNGYALKLAQSYGNARDNTVTIKNSSTTKQSVLESSSYQIITGSGNSKCNQIIKIEGDIVFRDIHGETPLGIELGTGAKLLDTDSARALVPNGGFSVKEADGSSYIYGNLANAAGRSADGNIVLLNNYVGSDKIASGQKDGVLDLDGHTYTYTGGDAAIDVNYPGVTLTVKNGSVVVTDESADGAVLVGAPNTDNMNNRGLVLDNVQLTVPGNAYGIVTNGTETGNTVTLKNNSVLNVKNGFGIYFPSDGEVIIDNSTINAKHVGVQLCAGDLTVTGESAITVTGQPQKKTEGDGPVADGAAVSIINRDGYQELGTVKIESGDFTAAADVTAVKAYSFNNTDKTEDEWAEAGNVVGVTGGSFSSSIAADIIDSDTQAAVTSGGQTKVVIGKQTVEKAAAKLQTGDKIDFQSVSEDAVVNLPEGVEVTNSTAVMMTTVGGDTSSIGYISLGSLNDTVKAVSINDVEPTQENIENGTYEVSRPFNIITKGDSLSEAAQNFYDFILSDEGQAVVSEEGYIPVETTGAFAGAAGSGNVVVAGSSSVTPVMEKLAEAFEAVNSNVTIEVQQSDSTTGVTATNDGLCDIGMASRDLKDDETSLGLTATVIATDGIAVIVNNDNPISNLTTDQVKSIYMGETTDWSEIQ